MESKWIYKVLTPGGRRERYPLSLPAEKRKIFDEIERYVDKRQIVLFTGLRRVGKTTLMYQIIDGLLKKDVKSYNIIYFSFDEMRYDL